MADTASGRRSAALPPHEINPAPDRVAVPKTKQVREPRKQFVSEDPHAPTRGLPAFRHQVKQVTCRLAGEVGIRYEPKPTTPNRAERRARANIRLAELLEEFYSLVVEQGEQRVVVWLNSKGGAGKSPGATVMACIISWATKGEEILLIDANENAGTTADRMGVSNNMTLKRVVEMVLDNSNMVTVLPRHRNYNVRVIASDQSDTTNIEAGKFVTAMLKFMRNVTSTVIDSGNGISHENNKGSAQLADALTFSALWEEHTIKGSVNASMKSLASTMREYAKQGLEEKVRQAFIVVSMVREAKTEQDAQKIKQEVMDTLERHFNMVSASDSEEDDGTERMMSLSDYGFTADRLVVVPYSSHIASNMPVDLDVDVIGINTLIAYLKLLIAIYKQPRKAMMATAHEEKTPMLFRASVGLEDFGMPSLVPTEAQTFTHPQRTGPNS